MAGFYMIPFPLEKSVNPWDFFGSYHERKIQEKSSGRAFESARFARR
jgi:hypothetical protein